MYNSLYDGNRLHEDGILNIFNRAKKLKQYHIYNKPKYRITQFLIELYCVVSHMEIVNNFIEPEDAVSSQFLNENKRDE